MTGLAERLATPLTDAGAAVEARGLAKRFGDVEAVRGVDLVVPRNSIFGFLGPNGAGKTTTMRMLVGLLSPTAGSAMILGHDVTRDNLEVRRRVGYLPQQPRFYPDLTARETLRFAAGFFYRMGSATERRIERQLDLVGLAGRADRPVGAFSGGERQRLGIAQAQLHEPELLILDEPAAGLDPIGRRDVLELLGVLRSEATVLYSTHILDDVQRVSDTVAIIARGRVVAQAPIDELLRGSEGTFYRLVTDRRSEAVLAELRAAPWVRDVEIRGDEAGNTEWTVAVETAPADREILHAVLADPGIRVIGFGRRQDELEDVFVRIVEGSTP